MQGSGEADTEMKEADSLTTVKISKIKKVVNRVMIRYIDELEKQSYRPLELIHKILRKLRVKPPFSQKDKERIRVLIAQWRKAHPDEEVEPATAAEDTKKGILKSANKKSADNLKVHQASTSSRGKTAAAVDKADAESDDEVKPFASKQQVPASSTSSREGKSADNIPPLPAVACLKCARHSCALENKKSSPILIDLEESEPASEVKVKDEAHLGEDIDDECEIVFVKKAPIAAAAAAPHQQQAAPMLYPPMWMMPHPNQYMYTYNAPFGSVVASSQQPFQGWPGIKSEPQG